VSIRVQPLAGAGLVIRHGDLMAVCADVGARTDALIALVQHVAAAGGGEGDRLVSRVAAELGEGGPACAVAGFAADGSVTVLVRGDAVAEVTGAQERVHLHGPAPARRTVDGPLRTVRLALPGSGAADPRTALDAGVVTGAGLVAEPAGTGHRPDRSAPFEAIILLPGHAEATVTPAPPTPADDTATRPLIEGVYCRDNHFNDPTSGTADSVASPWRN
jgi:hypothetical protein